MATPANHKANGSVLSAEQLAKLDRAFADAAKFKSELNHRIQVLSVCSTGSPINHPTVQQTEANGYLHKAAAKLNETSDLTRFFTDVFSCGWPDVAVTLRQSSPSENDNHSWSLQARLLGHVTPSHKGDLSIQRLHSG